MDIKKIIKGLEFTKAMITFNPSTGEDIEPGNLNEANKTTYDACVGAIALLKEQEAVEPRNTYSTTPSGKVIPHIFCGKCNKEIYAIYTFCPFCGQEVKWE